VFFFVKTDNPRPTFQLDMTAAERSAMEQHVNYWSGHAKAGRAIAFGPVADPAGVYGILIANLQDEDELKRLLAQDPARKILKYSYFSMPRAVTERTVAGT
jgi:uncharacterized protein